MRGRAFLDVARELVGGQTEAHWRSALSRAYYALFLECRDALEGWGIKVPPHQPVHSAVRMRFTVPLNADLKAVGYTLDRLGQRRNEADYQTDVPGSFATPAKAQDAITQAETALNLLDALDGDPARVAAAVAAIIKPFPP